MLDKIAAVELRNYAGTLHIAKLSCDISIDEWTDIACSYCLEYCEKGCNFNTVFTKETIAYCYASLQG
jgi:hypothetical protein